MNNIEKKIEKLVKKCGKILIKADREKIEVENKEGIGNYVTNFDKSIENILKRNLKKILPDANFIGEEEYKNNFESDSEYEFIVDPIDGTTNFIRNNKLSAISVALLKNNEPIFAICYNPYAKDLYKARKNGGAFLNGKKIHVSNKKLDGGLFFCGSSSQYAGLIEESNEILDKLMKLSGDFRRFGSSVIEICRVASGSAELFYECRLMPWDYAASSLILTEAGGKITTLKGEKIQYKQPTSILASNGVENILEYINK